MYVHTLTGSWTTAKLWWYVKMCTIDIYTVANSTIEMYIMAMYIIDRWKQTGKHAVDMYIMAMYTLDI